MVGGGGVMYALRDRLAVFFSSIEDVLFCVSDVAYLAALVQVISVSSCST